MKWKKKGKIGGRIQDNMEGKVIVVQLEEVLISECVLK